MKLFKLIAAFLISATILVSCGPNKPDNKQYGVEVKQNGFKPGPTVNDKPVAIYDTTIQIAPTWGQANHYASKRGDFLVWQILGVVLLLAFVVLIYGKATEASWFPNLTSGAFGASLAICLALSIVCFKWQSSAIVWENNKWIPKSQFDKAMQETGTTQPIWDSLENGCHIAWGPYNCYKK